MQPCIFRKQQEEFLKLIKKEYYERTVIDFLDKLGQVLWVTTLLSRKKTRQCVLHLMNGIGKAANHENQMALSLEFWHQAGPQYRTLTDARSAVDDKRASSCNLGADRFNLSFSPEEESRVSLSIVVEEFVRPGLGESNGAAIRANWPMRNLRSIRQLFIGFDNVSYKNISVFWNGFDVSWARSIVAQLFANVFDALCKSGISDKHAVPNLVEDAILLHQLAALTHKQQQHVEVFRVQGYRTSFAQEQPVACIQVKVIESIIANRCSEVTHHLNLLTTLSLMAHFFAGFEP